MKRVLSLILTLILTCTLFSAASYAADEVTIDQVTHYSYDGSGLIPLRMENGIPFIRIYDVATNICADYDYNPDTQTYTFYYADHKGSVTGGQKTAYLDGQPVILSYTPLSLGMNSVYVDIWSMAKLLDQKLYLRSTTASRNYEAIDENGKGYVYLRRGEPLHYIDICYNPGNTSYTKNQLTFMQGLAAPLFFNNSNRMVIGTEFGTNAELAKKVKSLKPISGVSRYGGESDSYKRTLGTSWGIADRAGLIQSIERLLESGAGTDKTLIAYDNSRAVQLAQTGYLVSWLTAEETITYGMQAAKQAQKGFASWSDYGDYYMKGAKMYLPSTFGPFTVQARQQMVDVLYQGDAFREVTWNIDLTSPQTDEGVSSESSK